MYFELSLRREVRYLGEEETPRQVVLPSAVISSAVIRLASGRLGATFFPFLFHLEVANVYGRHHRYDSDWIFLSEERQRARNASSHAALVLVVGKSITVEKLVHFLRSASTSLSISYAEGKASSAPIPRVKVEWLREQVLETEKV